MIVFNLRQLKRHHQGSQGAKLVDKEVQQKQEREQGWEGWGSLPWLWGRKVLHKGEEGLLSLFWEDKYAENINPAHDPTAGIEGDRRRWWNREQVSKKTQLKFLYSPLTWSVEVLRWSGQRRGVAMATVYCINAEGAVACRFWDAFPPINALLPERDQRCGKMCKKSLSCASKQMFSLIYRDSVEYSPLWFQIQLLVTKWERQRKYLKKW